MLRYDTASMRATQRSILGVSRENSRFHTSNIPDPSKGGTRGYPLHLRQIALNTFANTDSTVLAAASILQVGAAATTL